MTPTSQDLWFLPLGGTGEIGMNLNLFGHDDHWLMVDCGVTFSEPLHPGSSSTFDVVAPDPSFIASRKDMLAGIIITHAHEDHIGALPFLWQRFPVPVYTTPYTAEMFRRKLQREGKRIVAPIIEVDLNSQHNIGPFDVRWLSTTHSLPESNSLLISTAAGTILHTGDWKEDKCPVIGSAFDPEPFRLLQEQNIIGLIGDSTNALKGGHSLSERDCIEGLTDYISNASGRVIVSCFASNIARLITIARIAKRCGRYIAVLGRALENAIGAARATGYWPDDINLQDPRYMGYLPPEEVLIIATGSQGEPRAALSQIANARHRFVDLEKGDIVLMSAMVIPGNEKPVQNLVKAFAGKGIDVVLSENSTKPIHASGHPNENELQKMYDWVNPTVSIPVHGEQPHLIRHAEIAKEAGVKRQYVGQNGDLYLLAPNTGIRRGKVATGRIPLIA